MFYFQHRLLKCALLFERRVVLLHAGCVKQTQLFKLLDLRDIPFQNDTAHDQREPPHEQADIGDAVKKLHHRISDPAR